MVDKRKTSWLKRGLALFLAMATLLATTGINPGVFAEGTSAIPASSSDSLTQVFKSTATQTGSETVTGIKANLKLAKDVSYSIVYHVYQNFNVGGSIDEAAYLQKEEFTSGIVTVTGTGAERQEVPIDFGADKVILSQNENYAVKITVNNAAFSYYDNAGEGAYLNDAALGNMSYEFTEVKDTTNDASLPSDVSSISLSSDKNTIDTGDTLQITGTTNVPDKYRPLTFSSSNEAIAKVDSNGKVTAQSQAGVATITASYGSVNKTKDIYVVSALLATTSFSYDGFDKKPTPAVSGMNLVNSTAENGYMLTYPTDTVSAGNKTVTIKGYGLYAGYQKILTYTVTATPITQAAVDASTISVNSSGLVSAVSGFVLNGNTLVLNQDFTATAVIDSANSTPDYGMYTVTIKGKGNYSGEITRASVKSIYSKDNLADISTIITATLKNSTYQYMGRKITPVYSGMTTNISSLDTFNKMVTLSYGDNTSVGDGTVILTGNAKNGYTGTITLTFKITQRDIAGGLDATGVDTTEGKVRLSIKNDTYSLIDAEAAQYKLADYYIHTGSQINPTIDSFQLLRSYSDTNGADLLDIASTKDYTVTYQDSTSVGTGKMFINGTGNYTGTIELQYEIIPDFEKEMEVTTPDGKIYSPTDAKADSAGVNTFTTTYSEDYTGSQTTPSPILKLNRKKLTENTDYVITRENNINAGTATIIATGKDGTRYAGKKIKITYTINKRNITSTANLTFTPASYVYTGETVKPAAAKVTDVISGVSKDLTVDTDYTLSYDSAINVGNATVTATGKGNYTGKVTGTYTITPLSIENAKANPSSNPATDKTGILVNYKDEWVVTGSEIKPPVSLTYNNGTSTVTLSPSDYDVTYSNNTKKTTDALITITGRNNLSGTPIAQIKFKIYNHTFDDVNIKVHDYTTTKVSTVNGNTSFTTEYNPTYSAGTSLVKASDVTLTDATGNILKNQIDYTMSTSSSNATQGGTITILGKTGTSYAGAQATVTFKINKMDIADSAIKITPGKVDTNNKPTATVVDTTNGIVGSGLEVTLKEGTDYYITDDVAKKQTDTVTWPTVAGMHTFYINGIGNYTGSSVKLNYQIGKNLADSDVYYRLVNPGNATAIYYDSKPLSVYNTTAISIPYLGNEKPELIVYEINAGVESVISTTNYDVNTVNASNGSSIYGAGNSVKMMVTAKAGNTQYFSTSDKPVSITYTINTVSIGIGCIFSANASAPLDGLVDIGKYKQGIIIIDNSGSKAGTLVTGSDNFNYYFAHQTDKAVDSKLTYYPHGDSSVKIEMTNTSDYRTSPLIFNPDAIKADGDRNVKVKFTGLGNYSGTSGDVNYFFDQVDIANSNATINSSKYDSANPPKFSYQDGAISIDSVLDAYGANLVAGTDYTFTLSKGGTALTPNTDYTILYSGSTAKLQLNNTANTGIGTYTITYKGTGSKVKQPDDTYIKTGTYYGSRSADFSVTQRTLDNATASTIKNQTYDGTAKTPDFTVTDNGKTLVAGTDYKVDWSNNIYPGTATVVVSGIGKYSGTLKQQPAFNIVGDISDALRFTIDQKDAISGKTFTLASDGSGGFASADLNNKLANLGITRSKDSTPLVSPTDFGITTKACTYPGTGKVTITGTGNYTGTITYDVNMKGNIADAVVTDNNSGNYDYNGADVIPSLSLTYNGKILENGTDYSIDQSADTKKQAVGTHNYTIKGLGDYAGTKSGTFTVKYNLAGAIIKLDGKSSDIYTKEYTGAQIVPSTVTVSIENADGSFVNLSPSQYTLTYGENINPGKASGTVTIDTPTGSTEVYGKKAVNFEITAITLSDTARTKVYIQDDSSNWQVDKVIDTPYTGIEKTPLVKVTYLKADNTWKELTSGSDYTVKYANNTNAGSATITIEGAGQYQGKRTINFTINPISLADLADADNDGTYTNAAGVTLRKTDPKYAGNGAAVCPTFEIKYNGNTLQLGTEKAPKDYLATAPTPAYPSDTSVAITGTATITGSGNYKDNLNIPFTVQPRDISDVYISNDHLQYDGAEHTPKFVVKSDLGTVTELTPDVDFTATRAVGTGDPKNAGEYLYNVVGKGRFTNTSGIQVKFTIDKRSITGTEFEASTPDMAYRADIAQYAPALKNIMVKGKLIIGGDYTTLANDGSDYSVTGYGANNKSGIGTVMIQGEGNYTGSRTIEFGIGDDLSKLGSAELLLKNYDYMGKVVESSTDDVYAAFYYDGTPKAPGTEVTVGAGTTKLVLGTDYEIVSNTAVDGSSETGTDITNVGEKKTTIRGIGRYYGTLSDYYYVTARDASKDKITVELNLGKDTDGMYYATYTGNKIEPEVSAVYDDTIDPNHTRNLITDGDCILSSPGYLNNTEATSGSDYAKVELKFKKNFKTDTPLEKSFKIKQISLSDCEIALGSATLKNGTVVQSDDRYTYAYHGESIEPKVLITYKGKKIDYSAKDVKITYNDNKYTDKAVNAGKATVTVTALTENQGGTGNYVGNVSQNYTIVADMSKDVKVTIPDQFVFGGTDVKPEATVTCGDNTLVEGTDYTMTVLPSTNNKGQVVFVGIAPYYINQTSAVEYQISTDTKNVKIKEAEASKNGVPEYKYSGAECKPVFTMLLPDGTAYSPVDPTYTYVRKTDVTKFGANDFTDYGTFESTIEFTVKGERLSKTVTYKIVPFDISDNAIYSTLVASYIYNGEKQTISPYIRDTRSGVSRVLQKDTDYSVAITNAGGSAVSSITDLGTYTVTINGSGNYGGTIAVSPVTVKLDGMHKLSVIATSTTQIKLKWNRSHDVTGYMIANASTGFVYGETASDNYTVVGLKAGEQYVFRVTPYVVVSGKRSYGEPSDITARTTLAAATGTSATNSSDGKVNITWSTSANVDGYEVYRSATLSGTYKLAAIVPLAYGGFKDTQVTSGSTYYYKLRGYKKEANGSMTYGAYTAAIKTTY